MRRGFGGGATGIQFRPGGYLDGNTQTHNEAIEYGFVTSIQKKSPLAYIQGVFKAMISGVESDGIITVMVVSRSVDQTPE